MQAKERATRQRAEKKGKSAERAALEAGASVEEAAAAREAVCTQYLLSKGLKPVDKDGEEKGEKKRKEGREGKGAARKEGGEKAMERKMSETLVKKRKVGKNTRRSMCSTQKNE